jgi:MAE_28990/MAE_18760-like HEPN
MKIRSLLELQEALDSSSSWRLKELADFKWLVELCKGEGMARTLLRYGACAAYGHREGFVKDATVAYLEYVLSQRLSLPHLNTDIWSALMYQCTRGVIASERSAAFVVPAREMRKHLIGPIAFDATRVIHTEGNLRSEVLHRIMISIGIKIPAIISTKEIFIDHSLVFVRNEVSHGRKHEVDVPAFESITAGVLELISIVKNLIEDATLRKSFMHHT